MRNFVEKISFLIIIYLINQSHAGKYNISYECKNYFNEKLKQIQDVNLFLLYLKSA